jgi:hypothetical protein
MRLRIAIIGFLLTGCSAHHQYRLAFRDYMTESSSLYCWTPADAPYAPPNIACEFKASRSDEEQCASDLAEHSPRVDATEMRRLAADCMTSKGWKRQPVASYIKSVRREPTPLDEIRNPLEGK